MEAKKSVQRQALLAYGQTVVNAFGEVEDALIQYYTSNEQLTIAEQQRKVTGAITDLQADRLCSGLSSRGELLLAQKNHLLKVLTVVQAQRACSGSLIFVYKALGGGW